MTAGLLAEASPLVMLFFSVFIGFISVGCVITGWKSIKTKSAHARKLEKVFADQDGKIHGTGAVIKGMIMFGGGIVLTILSVVLFFVSLYVLFFGPIDLSKGLRTLREGLEGYFGVV